MAKQRLSVERFIATGKSSGGVGTEIEFSEFLTGSGVGGGRWRKTGVTGIAPVSQTPAEYYANDNSKKKHFVDSIGDEWIFIGSLDDYTSLGGFKADAFWSGAGGIIKRFKDRLFIDGAIVNSGDEPVTTKTWVGPIANGFMTYFDTRSSQETITSIGGVAHAAAARTSDNNRAGERASITYAGLAVNDKDDPLNKKSAWVNYGLAIRETSNTIATFNLEMNTANTVNDEVDVSPYNAAPENLTATYRARVGGEVSESGTTVYPVSVAYDITHHDAVGSQYLTGINVQVDSIKPDVFGNSNFAKLPSGSMFTWYYGGGVDSIGGRINSTGNSALNAVWIDFGANGLDFGKNDGFGDIDRQLRYNPNSKILYPLVNDDVQLGTGGLQFSQVNSLAYRVNGIKVVDAQQPAISDSAGGDEQAKINAILAALRAHGLIDT